MDASNQAKTGSGKRISDFFIVQAWLVLLLATFFGAALAGIQLSLAPKIDANKLNETLEKVPELILGVKGAEALRESHRKMEIDRQYMETGDKTYSVFQAKTDGKTDGWVIKTAGQGYGDKVELLIGVDADARTITGLFILDQKETPGLGNRIMEPAWRSQFVNKSTEQPLKVVKTKASAANEINAITGATISSRSVCGIINRSLKNLKQPLARAVARTQSTAGHEQETN